MKERIKQFMSKKRSLKKMIIYFMIFLWFIPIELLFLFLFYSYKSSYEERTDRMINDGVSASANLMISEIDSAINWMQMPAYGKAWEYSWRRYEAGEINKHQFFTNIKNSMKTNLATGTLLDSYAFYVDGDEEEEPLCYFSKVGMPYEDYMDKVHPVVRQVAEEASNYVEIHVINNHIYLIQNLYTITDYKRYGTLAVRINPERFSMELPMQNRNNVVLQFGDSEELYYFGTPDNSKAANNLYRKMQSEFSPSLWEQIKTVEGTKHKGFSYQRRTNLYDMGVYYIVSDQQLNAEFQSRYWWILVVTALLAMVFVYSVYYLNKHVELPLARVINMAKKIENGNIGEVIEGDPMPNTEFAYLAFSFNEMSSQVKRLFDTVYSEQIARKDAQIQALQSQINPHFLNNTLEMMNWQARMNNDIEVCKMIEALSIVLDYSINRDNVQTVYLSEELRCADAYLYIMSMRFGQRLKVEKEIDGELLQSRVPQLILQPLIENAIVHGIEQVRQGTILLKVYHDEKNIYLEVVNTGTPMTPEQLEKVQKILDGTCEVQPHEKNKHTSIGIRNVNERIKLVYGEKYGLSIDSQEDGRTVSRITIQWIDGVIGS